MKLSSGTLIAGIVFLLALLVAAAIAKRGGDKAAPAEVQKFVPVDTLGTAPPPHTDAEAAVVPLPPAPLPPDPVPALPSNWK